MQAKKTIKIIFILAITAIFFFLGVIFLNSHIERKDLRSNSANSFDYQIPRSLEITETDLQEGQGELNIVVYEDYTDIFSANFARTLSQLQNDYPNRLKIAYRFYNATDSSTADDLALAIICAKEQGRGLELRQSIFKKLKDAEEQDGTTGSIGSSIPLDEAKFNTCLNSSENIAKIGDLKAAAEDLSIYGSPTSYIEEEIIVGARPYDSSRDSNDDEIEGLKQMIERKLN